MLLLGLILFSGVTLACPGHLVPVDPFDRSGYNQAVYSSLVEGKGELFGIIEQPSFDAESAIYSVADYKYDKHGEPVWGESRLPKATGWYLELAVSDKNIYYEGMEEGKKPEKTVIKGVGDK